MSSSGRRLYRLVAVIFFIACAAGVVYSLNQKSRQNIWSFETGEKVPDTFMYLLFPTNDSVSFSDHEMNANETAWGRALLNHFSEMADPAVAAWDVHTSATRFVDARKMSFLPRDADSVDAQMQALVKAIGKRVKGESIRAVRFTANRTEQKLLVTIEVQRERVQDVYQYTVNDGKICPQRWYRK